MLNSEIGAGRIFDRSELALASTEFLWNDACIKQRFQSLYVLIAFGFGGKCQIQGTCSTSLRRTTYSHEALRLRLVATA